MRVLALDLAKQTGWACGEPCAQPISGTIHLDSDHEDVRYLQLFRRIAELIVEHGVTSVVFEASWMRSGKGRQDNIRTLQPLYGYRAIAMAACAYRGIHPVPVDASAWRRHFLGSAGGKRDELKRLAKDMCLARGWTPSNADEAESLGLLDYRLTVIEPRHLVYGMRRGGFSQG